MWRAKNKNKARHRHGRALTCLLERVPGALPARCTGLAVTSPLLSGSPAAVRAPRSLPLPAPVPVCNSLLVPVCLIHFVLFSAEIRNIFSSESQSSEFLYLPAAAYLAAVFLNFNTLHDMVVTGDT